MGTSSKKKRGQQRKAAKKEAIIFNTIRSGFYDAYNLVDANLGQTEHILQCVKNGSDRVTRVLATSEVRNFSYSHSGLVNVVLDFLKRCEDATLDELVDTNIKGNLNTPSLWINILDMSPDEDADGLDTSNRLHIAKNIGPLVRCMCNDTKRLFFRSKKHWRESIWAFQRLIHNMTSNYLRLKLEGGSDARKKVIDALLQHDGLLRSIIQWGFWEEELRPDISNELRLVDNDLRQNVADMGRDITANLILDADTTDVDGNRIVEDDVERLMIISATPIVNKDYDPTCMVSFAEGMVRHMKIDEWEEDDIWTQGDDVFIVEALMQRADCIDKGVITEVIDFGNSAVYDYKRALDVARLSSTMVQQWISPGKSQASDTRIAFAIRTGLIEMCLTLVERFWVEDNDKEDDSASSVCTSDGSVPLCPGHGKPCKIVKPCVILTSEFLDNDKGRQYYKCNMPEGEQCDFFDWVESQDVYRCDENDLAAKEEEDEDGYPDESVISFSEEDVEDTKLFDHIANVISKVNDVSLHQKTARAIRSKKESISEILVRLEEKDIDDKYKQLLDMVGSILDINGSYCCRCNKSLERMDAKICNGCHRMAYCSRACQKEDWADGHELTCIKKSTELEIGQVGQFQGRIMPQEIPDNNDRVAAKLKEFEMNVSMVQLRLFLDNSESILRQARSLNLPLADCYVIFDLRRRPQTAEVKRYTEFYGTPEELRMFEESRSSKHIICLYISSFFVRELLDKEQVQNVVMQKLYPHKWLLNSDQR